jgi:hypothetical protein
MRNAHHPKVSRRNDGMWVVNCPDCHTSRDPVPIGIGMALVSELTAERLRQNHGGMSERPGNALVGAGPEWWRAPRVVT